VPPEDLTAPERALWAAFPYGRLVDLRGGDPAIDDVKAGADWGPDRTVRAEVIARLLLGAVAAEPGYVAALRLTGARVSGRLQLAYAEVTVPLRLADCHLDERPDLHGGRFRQVYFNGSALPGLDASLATIDGNLPLIGVRCRGPLRLTGTHIGGALLLNLATLEHPGGMALVGNRLVIGDDVLLDGASVVGELRLAGARVGGEIDLRRLRLRNPGGHAFAGYSLRVGANLRAGLGFSAEGRVTLVDAQVTGSVDLSGGTLSNPGGDALEAMGLTVGGRLDLCDGFRATGAVRLAGARVAGAIRLLGATLGNPGGIALDAQHVQARELDLRGEPRIDGVLDVRHARFDVLHDDPRGWPDELWLDGLAYAALDPPMPAATRLGWLARDIYRPGVYGQLAASYRRAGDDNAARAVLLASQQRRYAVQSLPSRVWGRLQDITVGYGYRPLRAAAWLLVLLLLGTVLFALRYPPAGLDHPPAFNPFVYSLDLLLPIVDFGQGEAFQPYGWQRWLAYLLIAAGWILATTIAAGVTRALRRD
jgi:hypothetical protein